MESEIKISVNTWMASFTFSQQRITKQQAIVTRNMGIDQVIAISRISPLNC
uniref:Transposase n=1 Tax=Heterorhabditis bacteriophora TaxID=37862 RepID=A0A1I7WIV7_HETBA